MAKPIVSIMIAFAVLLIVVAGAVFQKQNKCRRTVENGAYGKTPMLVQFYPGMPSFNGTPGYSGTPPYFGSPQYNATPSYNGTPQYDTPSY